MTLLEALAKMEGVINKVDELIKRLETIEQLIGVAEIHVVDPNATRMGKAVDDRPVRSYVTALPIAKQGGVSMVLTSISPVEWSTNRNLRVWFDSYAEAKDVALRLTRPDNAHRKPVPQNGRQPK